METCLQTRKSWRSRRKHKKNGSQVKSMVTWEAHFVGLLAAPLGFKKCICLVSQRHWKSSAWQRVFPQQVQTLRTWQLKDLTGHKHKRRKRDQHETYKPTDSPDTGTLEEGALLCLHWSPWGLWPATFMFLNLWSTLTKEAPGELLRPLWKVTKKCKCPLRGSLDNF